MNELTFTLPFKPLEPFFIKKNREFAVEQLNGRSLETDIENVKTNYETISSDLDWYVKNHLKYDDQDLHYFFLNRETKKESKNERKESKEYTFYSAYTIRCLFNNMGRLPKSQLVHLIWLFLFKKRFNEEEVYLTPELMPFGTVRFSQLESVLERKRKKKSNPDFIQNIQKITIMSYAASKNIPVHELDTLIKFDTYSWDNIQQLQSDIRFDGFVELTNWGILKSRHEKNSKIFHALTINNDLIGFFILYPITKMLIELIENDTNINSAEKFPNSEILSDFDSAYGVYVSTVYSFQEFDKSGANVVQRLREALLYLLCSHQQLSGIYSKPRTPIGKRLAKNYNFNMVGKSETIQCLSREDALKKFSSIDN